jgi:DNA-binding NarL/FixJ family response regulator
LPKQWLNRLSNTVLPCGNEYKAMASSNSGSGGDFLEKKSGLVRAKSALPEIKDAVVIDDENIDADRMLATLRVMFGYEVGVRRAATIATALDLVMARTPDIVFLDDILKPSDDASQTIPFLRRAGYTGPIIVVSGQVTRNRRTVLLAAGATEVIHKDDVDSVRLSEALHRVFGITKSSTPPEPA